MTPFTFRLSEDSSRAVREALLSHGYVEYDPALHASCDLLWTTKRCLAISAASFLPSPRLTNHLPRTSVITQKDCLARSLRRMRAVYGRIFDFTPLTFILPRERAAWEAALVLQPVRSDPPEDCKEQLTVASSAAPQWILKPALSSQGRGIVLVPDPSLVPARGPAVVQRYIADPHLIHGHKYDLRLYLLVTSLLPLRAYVCREGLCRFSSAPYQATSASLSGHLTNSSLASRAPRSPHPCIASTCKWTLREYGAHTGAAVLPQLLPLLLLTLVPLIADATRCEVGAGFELLGLDVMRDRGGRWWLLEVNKSPSLVVKGAQDEAVKPPLLRDLLTLVGGAEGRLHAGRRSKGNSRQGSMEAAGEVGKGVGCWQALWPTTAPQAAFNAEVTALGATPPTAALLGRYCQAVVDAAKARLIQR